MPCEGPGQDAVPACGVSGQHRRELSQLHAASRPCAFFHEYICYDRLNVSAVCRWPRSGRGPDCGICIQLDHQGSWGTGRCRVFPSMRSCRPMYLWQPISGVMVSSSISCRYQTLDDQCWHTGTLLVGRMFSHDFDINTRSWYCFANIIASLAAIVEVCPPCKQIPRCSPAKRLGSSHAGLLVSCTTAQKGQGSGQTMSLASFCEIGATSLDARTESELEGQAQSLSPRAADVASHACRLHQSVLI